MSQVNVKLVVRLQPAHDTDLVRLYRDSSTWASAVAAIAAAFHADVECVMHAPGGLDDSRSGLAGLRELWLDWLAPWGAYRTEVEKAVDLGDRVMVHVRDFGRRTGSEREVANIGAAVWTVRDGKVSRIDFFATRTEARDSVGLGDH